LCDDYDAAGAERDAMKLAQRRATFMNPARWQRNAKGNLVRELYHGKKVTVFRSKYQQGYCYSIAAKKTEPVFSRGLPYSTEDEARAGALEFMERKRG